MEADALFKDRSPFARFLLTTRLTRQETVREFADRCGVSPSTISRLEIHNDLPKFEVVFRIAQALGLSAIEVMSYAYPEDLGDYAELARLYHLLSPTLKEDLIRYATHLNDEPKEKVQ